MSRDDYHVIVYYILKYLYECLKSGKTPDESVIRLEYYPTKIEETYLTYIFSNMYKQGYIDKIEIRETPVLGTRDVKKYISDVSNIEITPKGIEYLQENSLMQKAYNVVKDFKPW